MREKVVFLHLHKTGGLSANAVLARQYIGRPGLLIHRDAKARVAELVAMSQPERDRLAYISGHVYYGIHEVWTEPASYFTLLREPIARAVSNYNFLGVIPRGVNNPALRGEFDTYLRRPAQTQYMARHFAGYRPGHPGEPYDEDALSDAERRSLAEENLRKMRVVGLTEQFDASMLLLRRAFGWRNVYYVRRNTTAEKGRVDALPPDGSAELRRYYAGELALYEVGRQLFAEQCRAYGDSLEADLERYRRNNALYGRLFDATSRIRSARLYLAVRRMLGGLSGR